MKVVIDWGEWYPVYFIEDGTHGVEIDVEQSTINRWSRIDLEFAAMQKEMTNAVNAKFEKRVKKEVI